MIYSDFLGKKVSCLGLGNMRLPANTDKTSSNSIDWEKAHEIMAYAYEHGINYFDTAYVYNSGESERCLGEGMKKFKRDTFFFATKFLITANPNYEEVFEEQLKRLQTDYIDFYLIHCLLDSNIDLYLESGAIEFFKKKKEEGKIKHLGFSSHASLETLKRFAYANDWDFAQIQMNYYDVTYADALEQYKILEGKNIPIVIMEPVRGGRLSNLTDGANELLKGCHNDWSISSWAFRYLKNYKQIKVILSGMSSLDQLKDNLKTFEVDPALSKEDNEVLLKAVELFKKQLFVPCTSCKYCVSECPMEINIPSILKIYNDYKIEGRSELRRLNSVETKGTHNDCIECYSCTKHCPQGIEIPKIMKELREACAK